MSRWQTALRNAPLLLQGMYEYNWASRQRPLPLREWMFPVTYRCNARCLMCDIWQGDKGGELPTAGWATILQDPLFATVQSINLTGGEPTLRQDLDELVYLLIERLPALRRITLTTNALDRQRVTQTVAQLAGVSAAKGIGLFVGVSLDGIGKVHDEMRNIPNAFERVQETIGSLSGHRLGVNCTLTRRNLDDAPNVLRWCSERGLPVNFIVASFTDSYYANTEAESALSMGADQRSQLASLLLQLADQRSVGNLAAYFYADLARMVEQEAPRTTPCVFQKSGAIIDARGEMQYCVYSQVLGNVAKQSALELYTGASNLAHRQEMLARHCATCTMSCFLELGLAKDARRYIRFLLGGLP